MAEEDYTLLGMATLDPHDIIGAGIALETFINLDTELLVRFLRSSMGLCNCGSVTCGVAQAERIANGHDEVPPFDDEQIEAIKEACDRISGWFSDMLQQLKDEG